MDRFTFPHIDDGIQQTIHAGFSTATATAGHFTATAPMTQAAQAFGFAGG